MEGLVYRPQPDEQYLRYAQDRTVGASVPGAIGEQRGIVSRGREIFVQAGVKFLTTAKPTGQLLLSSRPSKVTT